MSIKTDFLAVASQIKAIPDRKKRILVWQRMSAFARSQRVLEEEELDRATRTDQDISSAKAMDIKI